MSRKKRKQYVTVAAHAVKEPEVPRCPAAGPVQVGEIVYRRPITTGESDADNREAKLVKGRVVYVHPEGRFHVVEFGEGPRAVRESFLGVAR